MPVPTAAFALGLVIGGAVAIAMADRWLGLPAGSQAPVVSSAAPPATGVPAVGRYAVDVVRVIDGDTFEARVHVWPGLDLTTRVRLRGIDAPEMNARCGDERLRAEAAREALRTILNEREVTIAGIGPDKYHGRVIADVSARRTADVSAALLAKGLARVYSGGRREGWCDVSMAN